MLGQRAQHLGIGLRPSHVQVWLNLVLFGSAWHSARCANPRTCRRAWPILGGLAQHGSAWFSLAQHAWPALARFSAVLQLFHARVWLSLALFGSAWLSAQHIEPGKSRRDLPCLRQRGSAWLSLAQPAGRASARSASAGLLRTPRFGSTWFSLAQPGSAPAARAPWACRCAWGQMRQLGSAWLSLAQLGSVCLSLPSLRAAFREPLCARVWLSVAQLLSAWRRCKGTLSVSQAP